MISTYDNNENIVYIVELQKQTIKETIDLFVYHCEHYINNNQNNAYEYLDMNDIRAIAKLLKGE